MFDSACKTEWIRVVKVTATIRNIRTNSESSGRFVPVGSLVPIVKLFYPPASQPETRKYSKSR